MRHGEWGWLDGAGRVGLGVAPDPVTLVKVFAGMHAGNQCGWKVLGSLPARGPPGWLADMAGVSRQRCSRVGILPSMLPPFC